MKTRLYCLHNGDTFRFSDDVVASLYKVIDDSSFFIIVQHLLTGRLQSLDKHYVVYVPPFFVEQTLPFF